MSHQFDHEKLNVYHEALAFVGHATELLERIPKRMAVYDQLEQSLDRDPAKHCRRNGKIHASRSLSLLRYGARISSRVRCMS